MKKTILCGIAATLFAANTLTAQTVVSYKDGTATNYTVSSLTDNCFAQVDSLVLSGSWANSDFVKLRKSIAEIQNLYLKRVNLSAVTFSGDITTGMAGLFRSCQKLEEFVMPTNPGNAAVSFDGTFAYCYALSSLDFGNISNITSLKDAFHSVSGLRKVSFSNTVNDNALDLAGAFDCCYRVTEIVNFDKLTNVTNWKEAFVNCEELTEIHIGSAVNSLTADQTTKTFDGCKKLAVYLPENATVPENWQQYSIFMFPISAVELTGNASWKNSYEPIILPQMTLTPTYAAVTEKVIRLSNDNFKTYTQIGASEPVDEDFAGYQIKVGVKNSTMTDFVFSNSVTLATSPKVWVRYFYFTESDLWSWYEETPSYFASQGTESDTIKITGYWTVSDLENLKTGINKKSELKNKLVKFDMSGAAFADGETEAFESLFIDYPNLETVIWPKAQVNTKISLRMTFCYCEKLKAVDNLQNLNNITNLYNTFNACKVESLQFSDSVNNNSISLSFVALQCFELQTIKNIDKFTNVTNWTGAFQNSSKIDTVYIGSDPNGLSEDKTKYTFSGCNAVKVMPWGVATLPETWQGYNNFVMPFSKIFYSGVPRISKKGGIMLMPDCKVEPSNVIATDFVYQLSNDDFATYTTHKQSDKLTGNYVGWKVRIGAKNARMTDYLFADTIFTVAQAAEFVSYTDGEATKVQMADVKKYVFGESDSIFVTGTLTQDDIDKLCDYAIRKYEYEYQSGGGTYTVMSMRLLKFDMSKAVFSGVHTLFPNGNGSMPLGSKLQTIILPETVYSDSISIYKTFAFNDYLTTIKNLENLINITNFELAFAGSPKITEIRLGTDPNRLDSLKLIGTFNNCNALKYLPDTVTNIPGAWRNFNNFVLPIESVALKGTIKFLLDGGILAAVDSNFVHTPSYVTATDIVWQFSNDGFVSNIIDYKYGISLPGNLADYKFRCAVKNERMKKYVYSTNNIAGEPMSAAVVSYYKGKTTLTDAANIHEYQYHSDCDSIIMYGRWTSDYIKLLNNAICSGWNGTNDVLQSVDMSAVTFEGDTIDMEDLFGNCYILKNVKCPTTKILNKVMMERTFYRDTVLVYVSDFQNFVNIIDMCFTFDYCHNLREIHLGTDPNLLSESYLYSTFNECDGTIKYLPSSVTEVPHVWLHPYWGEEPIVNVVLPLTDVYFRIYDNVKYDSRSDCNISLKESYLEFDPECAYVTDTIYEISFDDFVTVKTLESLDNITIPAGTTSFKLRAGFKNPFGTYYSEEILFESKTDEEGTDVGFADEIGAEFAVYPNPATEKIFVSVGQRSVDVQVVNAAGVQVLQKTVSGTTVIDIANLPQGVYFVKAGENVRKFVKD